MLMMKDVVLWKQTSFVACVNIDYSLGIEIGLLSFLLYIQGTAHHNLSEQAQLLGGPKPAVHFWSSSSGLRVWAIIPDSLAALNLVYRRTMPDSPALVVICIQDKC